MRRVIRPSAVLFVIAAIAACIACAFSGAASADPYTPNTQAVISVSTTTPLGGQTIEVSGQSFFPNENVKIFIGGTLVGTAHTDASGNFDPAVVVPAHLRGDQVLTGVGASGKPNDQDSVVLHVRVGASVAGVTTTSHTGGLAFTGAQIAGLAVLGVALLGAGAFALTAARRKTGVQH